jgi:hypothetical protein
MKLDDSRTTGGYGPWIVTIMLLTPLVVFWRNHFFFILDDFHALGSMAESPFWTYLNATDAEQWFPVFHLVYYAMIRIFGEHYGMMLLVNCIGTGVIALLVYRFLRIHWNRSFAFTLSLLYVVSSVHTATVWHAYNICYILCFGFFMAALPLADRYLRSPSAMLLTGMGLCAFLSITSHSFSILAIGAIPFYALLLGEDRPQRKFFSIAVAIGLVYLCFAVGYFTFAGIRAASAHNKDIVSTLPGPAYLAYWLYGAYLYSVCYLFGGGLSLAVTGVVGGGLFASMLALIWFKGDRQEKLLAAWALILNALPILLVGLARYKIALFQAEAHRYGIFTLVGAILLAGTAWRILSRSLPQSFRSRSVAVLLLVVLFAGQLRAVSMKRKVYLDKSAKAYACWEQLDVRGGTGDLAPEKDRRFCDVDATGSVTLKQVVHIKLFLLNQKPR